MRIIRSVNDWVEATKLAGSLLLEDGCVERGYIDKMIETCKNLGPYIAIMPGLAIPHARPEDGAKKLCFSALVVREGVRFNSHNDPVYILLAFSTPDRKSHVQLIQQLANFLIERGEMLVKELREAANEEDALNRLRVLLF